MKIRFESDDDLTFDKILSIPGMIIVVWSVLQEDNKYCPQVCLHECLYESVGDFWRIRNFCTTNILVIDIDIAFIFNGTKKW